MQPDELERRISAQATGGFAGVVRVDVAGRTELRRAYGDADRARSLPMTVDTRLGMASGSKTFTALAVLGLVEDGTLSLSTTARSLLGEDLPLIGDDVTVEHLLSHRSGIGDYLDEDAEDYDEGAYLMPVPVHQLTTIGAFLPLLDSHPAKFTPAGSQFTYCNGAFVVLALLAERASGVPYHDLVGRRVLEPAGLSATGFLRSDALPADAALGYVEVDGEWRSNVLHLPVLGSGDGGAFTTVDDMDRFWVALHGGRIVSPAVVADMLRPRSDWDADGESYGLGIWLDRDSGAAFLRGSDAGVSFISVHDPSGPVTATVLGNTCDNAWPVVEVLSEHLGWGTGG